MGKRTLDANEPALLRLGCVPCGVQVDVAIPYHGDLYGRLWTHGWTLALLKDVEEKVRLPETQGPAVLLPTCPACKHALFTTATLALIEAEVSSWAERPWQDPIV